MVRLQSCARPGSGSSKACKRMRMLCARKACRTVRFRFMMSLFVERNFGTSEYLYQISRNLNNLCDYEAKYGKIVMQPRNPDAAHAALYFDPTQPQTCSPPGHRHFHSFWTLSLPMHGNKSWSCHYHNLSLPQRTRKSNESHSIGYAC